MNDRLAKKIMLLEMKSGREINISVKGTSMNPTLYENDILTITACSEYEAGDILVYVYCDKLIVHRLLVINKGKYTCKGDNTFRTEVIEFEDIIGKVISVNGNPIVKCSSKLIALSLRINQQFISCSGSITRTKQTEIYELYKKIIIRKEEEIMVYQKNKDLEYIQTDETSLAVFDPQSGDTHFFDETGIDILNELSEPCDLDLLLTKLCQIYSVTPDEIKSDVEDFLNDVTKKKVVVVL